MNIQIKVDTINELSELYDELPQWQQTFFEALGSFMSGCDYLIINNENKAYMAMYCHNVIKIKKHELWDIYISELSKN